MEVKYHKTHNYSYLCMNSCRRVCLNHTLNPSDILFVDILSFRRGGHQMIPNE